MTLVIKTSGFDDYLAKSGGAYIKVLVLGDPDSGKTRSASYWPDPIYADCERGRMSVADRAISYGEIRSSRDMDALLLRLRQECMKPADKRQWRTLVIDTIDSYQRTLIAERLQAERKEALSGWSDWGFLDAKMTQLLQGAMNLPMNLVVNCHLRDESDGDDDNRMMIKKPKLKGDIKDTIAGEFDLIGYLEKAYVADSGQRVTKRQIRWHSEPRYPMAKDRSGRLPRFTDIDFTEDDYNRIYTSIVGDHVDAFPASGVLEELENGDVEPAAPDVTGGPVTVEPIPLPRKAAAAKKAAPKKQAAKEDPKDDKVTTTVEQSIEVTPAADETTVAEEQGVANVTEALGATEVEPEVGPTVQTAPAAVASVAPAEASDSSPVCGDQPNHFKAKFTPAAGCGRSLADENRDRINIALLKTKTYLCTACLTAAKATAR